MEEYDERQIWRVFHAARNGNQDALQRYLSLGFPVNAADENGETLLHKAAFSGQLDVVNFLLDRGANIDDMDWRLRQTAVIRAARIGHYASLDLLIRRGANLNFEDHQSHTALMKACASGHTSCVQLLIQENVMLNSPDRSGLTALMKAAYIGNLEIVTMLIGAGANMNLADVSGNTALKIAVFGGHVDCVRVLLCNDADLCARDVLVNVMVNWYPEANRSQEQLQRDFQCVKMLFIRGAYVNARDNRGNTLLMCAVTIGFLECVRFLCDRLEINVNVCNISGETPLMIAAKMGRVDIATACLDKGAGVNVVDMSGYTAIMHAAYHDHPSCVEILAARRADVNVVDRLRWTPLMHMAHNGHVHCVENLIQYRALVDKRNVDGNTACDLARQNNHQEVMQVLLNHLDE